MNMAIVLITRSKGRVFLCPILMRANKKQGVVTMRKLSIEIKNLNNYKNTEELNE